MGDNTKTMSHEPGSRMSKSVKETVFKLFEGKCAFCGRPVKRHKGNKVKNAATVDHITPRRKGGAGTIENARLLCAPCHKGLNERRLSGTGKPRHRGRRR